MLRVHYMRGPPSIEHVMEPVGGLLSIDSECSAPWLEHHTHIRFLHLAESCCAFFLGYHARDIYDTGIGFRETYQVWTMI